MPMTKTSCQQSLLVRRYFQLRQLTTTHMSGHQNKIFIVEVIKHLFQTMSISLAKEGVHRWVQLINI